MLVSEMSVDFHRTTQCYISEDRALPNRCCENLKSYILLLYFNFKFLKSTALMLQYCISNMRDSMLCSLDVLYSMLPCGLRIDSPTQVWSH
jgi:hypothetical protein